MGRLNLRLRTAWTASTTRDSGAGSCPALISRTQPVTAAMPPDRNRLHDPSRTRASPAGGVQRRTDRNRLRGGSAISVTAFCHGPQLQALPVGDPVQFTDAATLGVTALHVAAHTTHHRGQVMTRLRELGGAPPLVDYVIRVWSGSPAAGWSRSPGQPS